MNRVPVTIVGVNAPEFNGPKAGGTPEIFLPISLQPRIVPNPRGSLLSDHSFWWVMVMGRLKPGVTDRAAALSLGISFRDAFHATIPEKKDTDLPRFFLIRGNRGLDLQRDDLQHPIYLLLSLAGLILLIACANLANLLLARGAARQREMSVRLAIGAGRFRIARQVLTEALVLALMGGLAGLFVGYACRNIIPHLLEEPWSGSPLEIRFNWPVFGFALGLTIATGLLFGFMPAWRASRENINTGLQEGGRMSAGRSKALLSKSLVVCQVAVGLLLLIGAGLFVRTLVNLRNTSTGLSTERILLFALNPPQSHYSPQQRTRLYQRIEEKVAALPAVQSATLSSDALLAEQMDNSCYRPTADPARAPDSLAGAWNGVWTNSVGPRFFETFRIPIVAGRSLAPGDNAQAPLAGVINRRLAQKFFPTTSPIGQTLSACEAGSNGRDIRIVGVSADAKYSGLREDSPPTLYLSYLQNPDPGSMTFELKSAASPASLAAEIRLAVRQVDPDVPVLDVRTQMQQIDATLSQERLFATVTSTFGLLALLLVSAGIYGVTAYTVSRRTNEIGIRMALGADAWKVVIMVLRENSLLGVCGVVLGLVSAFALSRVVAAMLFGLRATDPLTYGAAGVLLIALTIAAGFAPARRAANVSPTESLRHD